MERKLQIVFALLTAGVIGLVILNFVQSPMEAKQAWLHSELQRVPESASPDLIIGSNISYSTLIAENSKVWKPIVDRPEKVVVVKKPEKPDINKLLEGVEVTRFKVGDRIKIISKNNPDGGFYGIGEKVNGCVLTEFTRLDATFTYEWKEGKQTLKKSLPRR